MITGRGMLKRVFCGNAAARCHLLRRVAACCYVSPESVAECHGAFPAATFLTITCQIGKKGKMAGKICPKISGKRFFYDIENVSILGNRFFTCQKAKN
jgi:hypothetical protein